jgi:hypothetical protein
MSWFWCLEHNEVEENAGCTGQKRLGPYPTATAAASALKRINQREAEQAGVEQAPAESRKAARR